MKEFIQLLPYINKQKGLYILGFIGSLFRFLIPLTIPLVIQYLVDDLLMNGELSRVDKIKFLLLLALAMIAIFLAVRAPMEYVRQFFMNKGNNNVMNELRKRAFVKVQQLDAKYFVEHKSGELSTRFLDDIEKLRSYLTAVMSNIWIEIIVLLFVVGVMLSMNVALTLLAITLVALQFATAHLMTKKLKTTTRLMMSVRSVLNGFILEKLQGALLSKLFSAEKHDQVQLNDKLKSYEHYTDKQIKINAATLSAVNVISDLTPFIVVLVGCTFVIDGGLTSGALIAFFAYVDCMRGPVAALVQAFPNVAEGTVALQRIYEFFDEPITIKDKAEVIAPLGLQQGIQFRNVSFAYTERKPLIQQMSFTLHKGKTYGFVGESGGGKSTILQLITRMYDPDYGEICVDGINIKDMSLASLRQLTGVVTQDSFLYSASILDNIRLGRLDATKEEVIEAAIKAHAHRFISALPEGYDTEVGERGVKLSGGQKQRIALARLFLKNSDVLLLDEATSALDNESEELVQHSIKQLGGSKTINMIAHRLSTVMHADTIFVVRNGTIVESGNHQSLLMANGYYRELYDKQRSNEPMEDRMEMSYA